MLHSLYPQYRATDTTSAELLVKCTLRRRIMYKTISKAHQSFKSKSKQSTKVDQPINLNIRQELISSTASSHGMSLTNITHDICLLECTTDPAEQIAFEQVFIASYGFSFDQVVELPHQMKRLLDLRWTALTWIYRHDGQRANRGQARTLQKILGPAFC